MTRAATHLAPIERLDTEGRRILQAKHPMTFRPGLKIMAFNIAANTPKPREER